MKNILLIVATVILLISAGLYYWKNPSFNPASYSPAVTSNPIAIQETSNTSLSPTKSDSNTVPLPTEENTIRTFFNLINEHRIPEAISMMNSSIVPDDSTKQAYGVQFNAIKSITVQTIEPSMKENWTDNKHSYKVTLEASVSSEAANAPIPYYGWGDNPNIRWVTIAKDQTNLWKIADIATGP